MTRFAVERVLVTRYRAERQVPDLREERFGDPRRQSKTFAKLKRAWVWVGWGAVLTRRAWCESGECYYGPCYHATTKEAPDESVPRCRYHDSRRSWRLAERFGRWLYWRASRP
jgi:hypothetical protein